MNPKMVLENGLRVVSQTMPQTQSVSVCLFVAVGSRYETIPQSGISHFLEHILFRGTERRPTSFHISEEIERVGGMLNGGTDKETTVFWAKVASSHFSLALDVLSDMLINSKFSEDDIEKERQIIIEELKMNFDDPSSRVGMVIENLLWEGNALGRDVLGTAKSVRAIGRSQLVDFHSKRYTPSSTLIAIAGGVEHSVMVNEVKRCFGKWRNASASVARGFSPYKERHAEKVKVEKRDIEQTHICMALHGVSLFDPRRYALDLLNIVLGSGMSCRLFREVRDRLGLAYSVQSFIEHLHDVGSLVVYAGVDSSKTELAIRSIFGELARFRDVPIPSDELHKAKEMTKGQLALRLEDSRNMAGWLGGQEIHSGKILSLEEVSTLIDAVRAEDIMSVARDLIVESGIRLAVVGPRQHENLLELITGS